MIFSTSYLNHRTSLKALLFFSFFLLHTTINGQSVEQIRQEVEQRALDARSLAPNFCGTMQRPENKMKARDIDIQNRLMQLKNNGTWNVTDGYGGGCDKDCDLTAAARTPLACSGIGSEIFRIPIAYTLNTTAGCVENIPTLAQLSEQVDMMNDFMACQNIPMQFYECQAPRLIDEGCVYNSTNVTNIPDVVNIMYFLTQAMEQAVMVLLFCPLIQILQLPLSCPIGVTIPFLTQQVLWTVPPRH